MNPKTKKILYKIFKAIWIIIGIFLLFWTILIYLKMTSPMEIGIIGWIILFTIGFYLLSIYAAMTILFLLIKLIIKIIKRKKKK